VRQACSPFFEPQENTPDWSRGLEVANFSRLNWGVNCRTGHLKVYISNGLAAAAKPKIVMA
jgi:hypothetical protein